MQDIFHNCQNGKRFHDEIKISFQREQFYDQINRCRHGRNFLNSQSKYNEARFKEIHSKLDEKGIHFVVASGNQYYQLEDFFTDYDDIDYVAENGALIRNPEKVYAVHSYPTEAVKAIEKFLFDQLPNLNFLVCGE